MQWRGGPPCNLGSSTLRPPWMEAILSAYLMMSMQAADDSPALSPGLISSHSADSCTHEHHCHCLEHLRELPFVHAVVDCVSRNSIGRIVASLTRNATDVLYPWAPWIISYHLATRVSLHVDEGGAEIVEVVADKKQSAVNWILPPAHRCLQQGNSRCSGRQ